MPSRREPEASKGEASARPERTKGEQRQGTGRVEGNPRRAKARLRPDQSEPRANGDRAAAESKGTRGEQRRGFGQIGADQGRTEARQQLSQREPEASKEEASAKSARTKGEQRQSRPNRREPKDNQRRGFGQTRGRLRANKDKAIKSARTQGQPKARLRPDQRASAGEQRGKSRIGMVHCRRVYPNRQPSNPSGRRGSWMRSREKRLTGSRRTRRRNWGATARSRSTGTNMQGSGLCDWARQRSRPPGAGTGSSLHNGPFEAEETRALYSFMVPKPQTW
jgi:hypothetical protein